MSTDNLLESPDNNPFLILVNEIFGPKPVKERSIKEIMDEFTTPKSVEETTYITKDSGKREEYPSGMRRDVTDGKIDYSLIDIDMLDRWAALMTRGAKKYGKRNWELANSQEELDRFKSSAFRHFIQWYKGETDEDHCSAVIFNLSAYEKIKKKIENDN